MRDPITRLRLCNAQTQLAPVIVSRWRLSFAIETGDAMVNQMTGLPVKPPIDRPFGRTPPQPDRRAYPRESLCRRVQRGARTWRGL